LSNKFECISSYLIGLLASKLFFNISVHNKDYSGDVSITLGRYLCWETISPRWYHPTRHVFFRYIYV